MDIKLLNENAVTQIRSSNNINSIAQCVTELVQNSLDAKSSAIAIRINLSTFRIQVVDNGSGITKPNLELLGLQYMTSKCHSLTDLRKYLKYYGYRGEALASIVKLSKSINVTSRARNNEETYSKTFENGGRSSKVEELRKQRPSCGTTVTVEGFLNGLPVRQNCVKRNELDHIKKNLESFVIIHPKISFSLRDDLSGNVMINSWKQPNIIGSFTGVHPEITDKNFGYVKVTKSRVTIEGLLLKELHDNKKLQYLYVNKRPIVSSQITNLIESLFKKKVTKSGNNKHPVFVIQIKCPYSEIDLELEPTKTCVLFKKIDVITRCVKKLICNFLGEEGLSPSKNPEKKSETKSQFGVSQIAGAVRACGVKRKLVDGVDDGWSPPKSPKIIIENISPEPKEGSRNIIKSQPKMALPIKITKINDKERTPEKSIAEMTIFTNFPENERTGKEIIMDMFLKSTQVYPGNDESYSGGAVELAGGMGHQTICSYEEDKKVGMVSVGVQTESSQSSPKIVYFESGSAGAATVPKKSLQKFVSDYNFDFSNVEDVSGSGFNLGNNPFPELDKEVPLFTCGKDKKIFNFNSQGFSNNVFDNSQNFDVTCLETAKLSPILKKPNFDRLDVVQSPYFKRKIVPPTTDEDQFNTVKEPFSNFNGGKEEKSDILVNTERKFLGQKIQGDCKFNSLYSRQIREERTKILETAFMVTPYRRKKDLKVYNKTITKFFTPCQKKDSEISEDSNTNYQEVKKRFDNFLKPNCLEDANKTNTSEIISKFFTPRKPSESEISRIDSNVSKFFTPGVNNETKISETIKKFSHVLKQKDLKDAEIFRKRDTSRECFNETTNTFFTSKDQESPVRVEENVQQVRNDESGDLFLSLCSKADEDDQTHLVVTLMDEEAKQKIIARDLNFELAINKNRVTQTQDKTTGWVKEVNSFGTTVYVNLVTGVRSLSSPKQDNTFGLVKRIDFVPKGLSPILKETAKVDPLTPGAKKFFDEALIGSLEDELLLVKWQNYIGEQTNPRLFFDEMYKKKSKLIEGAVPNVNKSGLAKNLVKTLHGRSFTKQLFDNLVTVGQVDCKFIATFDKSTQLLLLFDQHAVHERVRLELLLEGYRNSSAKIDNSITIFLPKIHSVLIKEQKAQLNFLGLVFDDFTDGIVIYQVPLCVYNKFKKGANLTELVETLIKEVVESLQSDGVLIKTPQLIQNLINMEACRGAIKFGDRLDKEECTLHLKNLSECALPFQCAHGRPTLTPLILLDKNWDFEVQKPNLHLLK